ncbi:MAG: acyl carrier protein [Proteobacteria bacterium]|nr:acyl carrier protein [Pseudomonadota bacterium]
MNIDGVIARVDQLLLEEFELEPAQLVPEATLREDLDMDSLDALDLTVLLEKEFEVDISEDDLVKMRTVADVREYVRTRFAEKAS